MSEPILEVNKLSVAFRSHDTKQLKIAIQDISFSLQEGESLGIIGESGSGKSITLMSIMGLITESPGIYQGAINIQTPDGKLNLLADINEHNAKDTPDNEKWKTIIEARYKKVRGKYLSMIVQNPKLAFNPYFSIGRQISEMIRLHTDIKSRKLAKAMAIDWLARVKMDSPEIRYLNNPYGLSGGMCQRAMIAMALSAEPKILIADEPTTGLDATIQANLVDLLKELKNKLALSMILVSHNIDIVSKLCNKILVYYNGMIIEEGPASNLLDQDEKKKHPYTKNLVFDRSSFSKNSEEVSETNEIEKTGCPYANRCKESNESVSHLCGSKQPGLFPVDENHKIRCWLYHE